MKNIYTFCFTLCAILVGLSVTLTAQPLTNKYQFAFPDTLSIDSGLVRGIATPAGARGRLQLLPDGHLGFANGDRQVLVGTTVQWTGVFPDSATAIRMAERMQKLGINCVRLTAFDYQAWSVISILADGPTSLGGGLHVEQMKKFDWFMHQLRQHGIYYVFNFYSIWQPREGDGIRQRDSIGWGSRMPLFFDAKIQNIHRGIIKLLLNHENSFTNIAYKDDPALAYVVATEDGSPIVHWMYTQDVVRTNQYGNNSLGSEHMKLMDSLYNAHIRGKGLATDAALNAQWKVTPTNVQNLVRNGGFEDPFSAAWTFGASADDGAQAILQFTETDKKEGLACARIRVAQLAASKAMGSMYLYQPLGTIHRLSKYRASAWMRTTPEQKTKQVRWVIYNGSFPYNGYGLANVIEVSGEWKKYEIDFVSVSTDEATATLQIQLGTELGDLYIDDFQIKEIGYSGLNAGESIANNSVKRTSFWDASISPARAKTDAEFYFKQIKNMYDGVLKMVRDTLNSKVLLCPSNRLYSALEFQATKDYDVFAVTDQRNNLASMLKDINGGSLAGDAQARLKGKAFVVSNHGIAYSRSYMQEVATVVPAYAGLHDWDGVFFSIFTSTPRAGNEKVDSASYWEIFDKPNVLALLPAASNALRNRLIKPSTKVIEIAQSQEALDYPRLHANMPYSLGIYTDNRMPLFRRIETSTTLAAQESLVPHREISALSGTVDPTAYDAENEQIFWDATKGLFRVITPSYVTVSGSLMGQIVTLPNYIVEQTTPGVSAVISISSLTADPILISSDNLLTVSTRCLNEGTVFAANNDGLTRWGNGLTNCEGIGVRLTLTSASMDSCIVTPLNNQGLPSGAPVSAVKTGNRFSVLVNTQASGTPWFKVRFASVPTSVDEDNTSQTALRLFPNPSTGLNVTIACDNNSTAVTVYSLLGEVVARGLVENGRSTIQTAGLPPGTYVVRTNLNAVGRLVVE
ncbi:MAG: T9SS type A sorting domain-containing protein [Ignavibacteria bacterium]|nr:T9SS type A sorting domain-containing protein [Ignavibacteria bacterium]